MRNVLLLAMSTLNKEIKDGYYQTETGKLYVAQSQLEPITHMLYDERRQKGEKLDKIIILETYKTRCPEAGGKSAVAFYKERVSNFLEEGIEYEDISIDEEKPANGIKEATSILLNEYEKQKKNKDQMNLWIDTQGGFRDVVMVFNAIISLLREQGIEPAGIYSIRYNSQNTQEAPCPIVNQTHKYDIFKFVSAMQEFIDFGKATGLKKYYGEENELVQLVDRIADAIQMCQPQKFEEALQCFAGYLDSGQYLDADPYLQIFVEFMKNDYGILLKESSNTIEQIRWCIRKEFYQQAMTIYIEKVPKYYYDKKIVQLSLDSSPQSGFGKNPYADAFYTGLFEEMLKDKKDEQFDFILNSVNSEVDTDEFDKVADYLERKKKQPNLDPVVRAAIDKLINRLDEKFGGSAKKGQKKGSKTTQEYIRNICGAAGRGVRSELLYGKTPSANEETYERKIRAINETKCRQLELTKKMEYYLAIKILRNRMNHASEDAIKEDEQKAIAFLQSEQIDLGINIKEGEIRFDYQKIKTLLTDAVEAARCVS